MKAILNKISEFKENDDTFKLGSALTVGFLLIGFVGATIYVLLSSLAS